MPIDVNDLRDYKGGDPDKFRTYMKQRFKPVEWVDDVLREDEAWRDLVNRQAELKRQSNKMMKEVIAPKKKAKEDCDKEVAEYKALQAQIKEIDTQLPVVAAKRDKLLNRIGNIVDPEVPISQDEDADNLVVRLFPSPADLKTPLPCPQGTIEYSLPTIKPLTHDDLLWRIGGFEPVRGQNVAGHRAYFLTNAGVMLNQAIINYGIAFLTARGYNIVQPPFFMNKEVMAPLAQLEDFDEQLYKVSGKTDDPEGATEKYLIATSEQPLCAYHKGEWVDEKSLPLRYAGISTCFRKEAGSSGRDIRGIFRVHQFEKVEQFCLTTDDFEVSQAEQQRMLQAAKDFYESLGFPYRVVCIVSGELNDAAVKKYDLEGWFPGQKTYRELVSCSNCTDYQARGVGTRCGQVVKSAGEAKAKARYVHMLNSTLCATGRGICCLLENYQTETGVVVPEVLRPYMGGVDFLPFVRGPMELSKGEKGGGKGKGKKGNKGDKDMEEAPKVEIPVVELPEGVPFPAAPRAPLSPSLVAPGAAVATSGTAKVGNGSIQGGPVTMGVGAYKDVNLASPEGMATLNNALKGKNFLKGDAPTKADTELYDVVKSIPSVSEYSNVQGWVTLCTLFTPATRAGW